jgi:hypothetical protein
LYARPPVCGRAHRLDPLGRQQLRSDRVEILKIETMVAAP